MYVMGMEKNVFRIIPLTIIPLTSPRPFPSAIRHLRLGCGSAALGSSVVKLVVFLPSAFSLQPSSFRWLQVADAGHCQQRKDVRHVVFAHDDDGGFAQRNPVAVGNFMFFTVGHSNQEGDAFVNRRLNFTSRHGPSILFGKLF
jgi:hypothetical protein